MDHQRATHSGCQMSVIDAPIFLKELITQNNPGNDKQCYFCQSTLHANSILTKKIIYKSVSLPQSAIISQSQQKMKAPRKAKIKSLMQR